MSILKKVNISEGVVVDNRDITLSDPVRSVDVNQTDGSVMATIPKVDTTYDGFISIHPQSLAESVIQIKSLGSFGSLYYPSDAKFDYLSRRIWICDSGNHRVLKVNRDSQDVEVAIDSGIYYPYALAVNLNNRSVFVKCYADINMYNGLIVNYASNGDELKRFEFPIIPSDESSSTSSSSSSSSFFIIPSSSSSSSYEVVPSFPSVYSLVYDHVRSKLWWVHGSKIYMCNERSKTIQIYNINTFNYFNTYSVDVELASGNAFVVAGDNHDERFLLQIYKDNNLLLGEAYIR